MLSLLVLCILESFSIAVTERISLTALPSKTPQNGSRLHLICNFYEKSSFNIIWKRNNQNVGEMCLQYKKFVNPIQCNTNKTSVEWILDPVTYLDQGLWSCSHGKEMANVTIVVNGDLLIY